MGLGQRSDCWRQRPLYGRLRGYARAGGASGAAPFSVHKIRHQSDTAGDIFDQSAYGYRLYGICGVGAQKKEIVPLKIDFSNFMRIFIR